MKNCLSFAVLCAVGLCLGCSSKKLPENVASDVSSETDDSAKSPQFVNDGAKNPQTAEESTKNVNDVPDDKPEAFIFTIDLEQFYRQQVCNDHGVCKTYRELNKRAEIPIYVQKIDNAEILYDLDCNGDGKFEHTGLTSSTVCHYEADKGRHQIALRGKIPGLSLCGDNVYGGKLGFSNNYGPVEINQWGNISWQTMHAFAQNCLNMKIQAKDAPNLTHVKDMSLMFRYAEALNENIGHWDVSHVENMEAMFEGASSFNQSLETWNVSKVKNMRNMFIAAFEFNQPLNAWNVGHVEDMANMFSAARAFNQPINQWKVSEVKDMSGMFSDASSFNQPIGSWDVSKVKDMAGMFRGAASFNQSLDSWDVGNVELMDGMFNRAEAFNQPLASWDVSKVTTMGAMFWGASRFNQDLSGWNPVSLKDASDMFQQSGVKTYPKWYRNGL